MNKIKYGLKNVHYALIINTAGVITYGIPTLIPGAVNISLKAKGEKVEFYADDSAYFVANANQGYEGSIEMALLPDTFKKDVLGEKLDMGGVLFEDANVLPKNIALIFEFTGDANAIRHLLYNISVARPSIESGTKNASIEVKTETLDITASPALDTGYVKAKAEPTSASYATWLTTVYKYTPIV